MSQFRVMFCTNKMKSVTLKSVSIVCLGNSTPQIVEFSGKLYNQKQRNSKTEQDFSNPKHIWPRYNVILLKDPVHNNYRAFRTLVIVKHGIPDLEILITWLLDTSYLCSATQICWKQQVNSDQLCSRAFDKTAKGIVKPYPLAWSRWKCLPIACRFTHC